MSLQQFYISPFDNGLINNVKPFLIPDQAFQKLFNAYVFRGRVHKREGKELVARLRRCLVSQAQAAADGTGTYTIADILAAFRALEPNAELEPGSVIIRVDPGGANETEFSDQKILPDLPDGTFSRITGIAYDITDGAVNYITGSIELNWTLIGTPPNLTAIEADFCYFPTLPSMGIIERERADINDEQTVFFDTIYAYIFSGSGFLEFIPGTTWQGSDSDFFWGANYRGSDAFTRLLFVTNFFINTGAALFDPIRYTNGSTWLPLTPSVGGTFVTDESLGNAIGAAFGPVATASFPIVPGTVTIKVGTITFTDQLTAYPNGNLIGKPSANSGTINYLTGTINLAFVPPLGVLTAVTISYLYEVTYLFQARILIPYYGRLLALNTWEGEKVAGVPDIANAKNFFNRCRFSQIGDPLQQNAWQVSIFGKGGFIDAPVNEEIVSAIFYKNTLVVYFEQTTWQLRYVGEYGLPFIWERISSDFGAESTFSAVLFDDGVRAIGDKAIIATDSVTCQRMDLQIPDLVFSFSNVFNGTKRIQGIRNYQKELVYWCYPDGLVQSLFPNNVLVYNYRNNTFAIFRDSVTAFGTLQNQGDLVLWDSLTDFWHDLDVFWDDPDGLNLFPSIVSGNAQGFIHRYASSSFDEESLSIQDIDTTTYPALRINVVNHNLFDEEFVKLTGLLFIDINNAPVATNLNDRIYQVEIRDDISPTSIDLFAINQNFLASFTPSTGTDFYVGGGKLTLLPRMEFQTKDFNPFQTKGTQCFLSYIDFLTDATPHSEVSIEIFANSKSDQRENIDVGNQTSEDSLQPFGYVSAITQSNPAQVTSASHGLLDGNSVTFEDVQGMIQVNGNFYVVTVIDENNFFINTDSTAFTPYTFSGTWTQDNAPYYEPGSEYAWHRFYATCTGQYLNVKVTYGDDLMGRLNTHNQTFILNAMGLYMRGGSRNVF